MYFQRHIVAVLIFLVKIISTSSRASRIAFALLVVTIMIPRMPVFGPVTSATAIGAKVAATLGFAVQAMHRDYVPRDGSPLGGENFVY